MWLKAVSTEFKLSPGRLATLEAFMFCADPVNGIGSPSIATIMEKVNGYICYDTVMEHMKWLVDKKILTKQKGSRKGIPRHKTPPNIYTLSGYEFKLEDYSRENSDSLNLSLSPVGEKRERVIKFKKKERDNVQPCPKRQAAIITEHREKVKREEAESIPCPLGLRAMMKGSLGRSTNTNTRITDLSAYSEAEVETAREQLMGLNPDDSMIAARIRARKH